MTNRFVACAALTLTALQFAVVDLGARGDWTVLEDCRLVLNPANDGDSFHISAGEKEYVFRLYLVDAPETEGTDPARLIEQAKHFGISVPQAIEVGEAAKAFTREKLAEAFTVFTRMSGAMGRSTIERLYAFVQTKEGDLGEQLVRNGLARVHGAKAIPPGFSSSRAEQEKLQQLEDAARQEKIGGWGINAGRLNVRAQKSNVFTVFALGSKPARGAKSRKSQAALSPPPSPSEAVAASSPVLTPAPATKKSTLGKVDINTATEKELRTIPGIGPVMARRIIDARPFKNADELKKVDGIGDKKYPQLRPYFN